MDKLKLVAMSTLGTLIAPFVAFAAADQDVIDAATSTATTMKENLVDSISAALPIVIIAGVLVLAIFVVWRLGRRFVGGR